MATDPNKIRANMPLLNRHDFQKQMFNMRQLRSDASRAYRFARRALFKGRHDPRAIALSMNIMEGARQVQEQNPHLRITGGVQRVDDLKDAVIHDMAAAEEQNRNIDALNRQMAEAEQGVAPPEIHDPSLDEEDEEEEEAMMEVVDPYFVRRSHFIR